MNAPYAPLFKKLCGKPMMVEVADPARQAVDVIKGFFWDLFFDDTVALFVTFVDENVAKSPDLIKQEGEEYKNKIAALQLNPNLPKPTPPTPVQVEREFRLRWVRVANIIMVETDAHVKINRDTRQMTKPKTDPLYTDGKNMWHMLNNHVSRQIAMKLGEMGLTGYPGVYRNEQNEIVTRDQAVFAPPSAAPVAEPAPAPVAVEAPVAAASPVSPVF